MNCWPCKLSFNPLLTLQTHPTKIHTPIKGFLEIIIIAFTNRVVFEALSFAHIYDPIFLSFQTNFNILRLRSIIRRWVIHNFCILYSPLPQWGKRARLRHILINKCCFPFSFLHQSYCTYIPRAQKIPTALSPKYQLSYILQFGVLIKVYTESASFQKRN